MSPGEPINIFDELGEMALASRLRALSETLMQDAAALYTELGIEFEPHWFGLFQALRRRSQMGVVELSQTLGMSHPAVRKTADQLISRNLVRESRDRRDERRRLLGLTPRGRRLARRLAPIWEAFRASAAETLEEAGVDLLADLKRVEVVCAGKSIADRVRARLGLPLHPTVRIVDYCPAYKKHFKALNQAWLREHFAIEPSDARILGDPNRRILKRGGAILFALEGDRVVGTCALLRHCDGQHELTKMAVAPAARGRGIGTALVRAAIARAQHLGADVLYLQTSPRLRAAGRLYRRLGFRRLARSPLPPAAYGRGGVTMRLELPADQRIAEKEE